MSQEFQYNIITFHFPAAEKDLVLELGKAFNEGWKPTGGPVIVQTSFPGNNGGVTEMILIYTLAKEIEHEAH